MESIKQKLKDRKRFVAIAVAVTLFISATAYAMTVDNFTDYNPPNELYIYWGDYWKDGNMSNGYSADNAKTAFPAWSAEYPYRAVFLGAKANSSVYQKYEPYFYIVYSKVPTSDLFTFEYVSDRGSRYGHIRAKISTVNEGYDKNIRFVGPSGGLTTSLSAGGMVNTLLANYPSSWNFSYSPLSQSGGYTFFDFDFYYDCAAEHNQNASNFKIGGITSISAVPYKYVIHCVQHSGWAGNGSSGGDSSSGSSSGGSSSGSSGSGLSGDRNTGGDGGRHGWGTGDYGGGVNQKDIVPRDDGGDYASRPDLELSVPDDWKKPIEDNYSSMPDSEYVPDYPEYIPAEGDTGQNGEYWELPQFGTDDGVSGTISGYKELKPNGEYGLIDFMKPPEEWLE